MVQTVQQTTEIPQMPFVFRWSMTLLCRSCGSTGCSSPYTAHLLGSTVDTNFASVDGEFHVFLREKVDYGS